MKSAVSTSDTLGLMLRDLDQFPMPDHEQQVELAKRVAAGDDAARKQMVAANLRLVVHWARRYQDRGVDMADLVQEGTFGLMRAVDKFDWERGFRFSTYATWWIRQALQRAVQQHGRTIRIPLEVGEQIQRLELTKAELAEHARARPDRGGARRGDRSECRRARVPRGRCPCHRLPRPAGCARVIDDARRAGGSRRV